MAWPLSNGCGKRATIAAIGVIASANVRRPMTELAELIDKMPTLQALHDINDGIMIAGGGLPVEVGGEVVGGIGVGGAPGAHPDDACAQDGFDAIGAAPKVTAPK